MVLFQIDSSMFSRLFRAGELLIQGKLFGLDIFYSTNKSAWKKCSFGIYNPSNLTDYETGSLFICSVSPGICPNSHKRSYLCL